MRIPNMYYVDSALICVKAVLWRDQASPHTRVYLNGMVLVALVYS